MSPFKSFVRTLILLEKVVTELGTRFASHNVWLLSGGIAFNLLLCLIPTILITLSIIGRIWSVDELASQVQETLETVLVPTPETRTFISSILEELHMAFEISSLASWVAAGVLLWTASTLFGSLRSGLNSVFEINTPKFFLLYKIKDIVFTILVGFGILFSGLVSPLLSIVLSSEHSWMSPTLAVWLNGGISEFITWVGTYLFFLFLYRFVPNKRLPKMVVVASATIGFALWELARWGFTTYLLEVTAYGKFYGTYAILSISAIWIYYSAAIILTSAELAEFLFDLRANKWDINETARTSAKSQKDSKWHPHP